MPENPYSGILNVIGRRAKGQIPVTFRIGKVTSKNPLKISVSQTEQSGNDLLKNFNVRDLYVGDNVLLIPLDNDQKYLILCKVVGV